MLDLEVAADFRTPSINSNNTDPFDFTGDLSDFNVGLSFDTPIDQIQERNVYRQSLVNYQRARRNYMLFEDQIKQDVRGGMAAIGGAPAEPGNGPPGLENRRCPVRQYRGTGFRAPRASVRQRPGAPVYRDRTFSRPSTQFSAHKTK